MNSFFVAVVLSAGCCNCGNPAVPPGFVQDVKAMSTGATTACHKADDSRASLDFSQAARRFDVALASFNRAANNAHKQVAEGRNRLVAAGLRSTVRATKSTFVESHIRLIGAAQPLVSQAVQSLLLQPSAASGVLWDDRDLLDKVSRIA